MGGGDDENVANASHHQKRDRIENERLVEDRQKLL